MSGENEVPGDMQQDGVCFDELNADISHVSEKEIVSTKDQDSHGTASISTQCASWYRRQDLWLWFSGIIFCAVLVISIQVGGHLRGWDADSGHTHNVTNSSQERFLPEPYIPEEGVRGRYGAGATARWYYWQLKPELTSVWTHLFPWLCYVTHQILIWATIYYAQIVKAHEPLGKGRYSSDLSRFNIAAFALNAVFHVLHFVNTHVTYDATAPDVSVSTSQGSVIMLLVFIVLLEYKERGIFFRWPTTHNTDKVSRKITLNYGPIYLVKRYHGFAFAWAAIYTFWYHPMENTWGHVFGFIYTWIIMLQGSLMYTSLHLNPYWRMTQELFVILHGGIVASQTGGDDMKGTSLWPMFTFGFLLSFVLTQVFTPTFWTKIHFVFRFIPLVLYIAVVTWAYSWIPDKDGNTWTRMPEIIRIPAVYYLFFFIGWALLYGFIKLDEKFFNGSSVISKPAKPNSAGKQVLLLSSVLLIYGVQVGLSIIAQLTDWKMDLIVLMIIFVAIFTLGVCVSMMFLKHAIPAKYIATEDISDRGYEPESTARNDLDNGGKGQNDFIGEKL